MLIKSYFLFFKGLSCLQAFADFVRLFLNVSFDIGNWNFGQYCILFILTIILQRLRLVPAEHVTVQHFHSTTRPMHFD